MAIAPERLSITSPAGSSLNKACKEQVELVYLILVQKQIASVERSAKVTLPFWLANELFLRRAVSINVPACFSLETRKEIQADAACVDLRFRSPYFYELGCKILPL
ncbi:hypothetical protein MA16_Dca027054 [Dendrobium catenatum]|uniref:Uncharacterized protein n=1 Tax=Dendrobium catenatum TaxID=906689 RepID=A0A2I0WRM0_9ASPA|nr:hypothetical protein MA16_Dca027054 [Dendrobium catenatum]